VREILDWRVCDCESDATWGDLFSSLKARGLSGVELIVSDAHKGIQAAIKRQFQGVAWQRCRVHFKRELARKVSRKRARDLLEEIAFVFASDEESECLYRAEEMASRWEGRYPSVATMLRSGVGDCLTVLQFPAHHRKRLTSTNLLENLMKRLKKRTRVVGVFPNRASCDRLIGAQLIEVHEAWQTQTMAYFNMDLIEPAEPAEPTRQEPAKAKAAN
jgi:putative transposase